MSGLYCVIVRGDPSPVGLNTEWSDIVLEVAIFFAGNTVHFHV